MLQRPRAAAEAGALLAPASIQPHPHAARPTPGRVRFSPQRQPPSRSRSIHSSGWTDDRGL